MLKKFGIKDEIIQLSKEVEKEIEPIFKKIDEIKEINSIKVLSAFQECGLSEMHLHSSTGYGIDEVGRNKIEEIYAKIFNTEDALVRAQLISGTHALAVTLFGILRPGDIMLSISGAPYDTLQTAIGISKEQSKSSLKSFGVKYEQIELKNNDFDIDEIIKAFEVAQNVKEKPTCIIAKTIKGKGVSFMENKVEWHGKAPNKEQYEQAIKELT